MRLHDMHLYDFLFGLRITNWHGQTVAPVLPESILGHGPSVFQHSLHALGHARDQALWRRVAPRNPQQLPAERREGVRLLLLSPQRLLRPAPHVLLRVHIRRILRPTRHGADAELGKCALCLIRVQQPLAVDQDADEPPLRKSPPEERTDMLPHQDSELGGVPRGRAPHAKDAVGRSLGRSVARSVGRSVGLSTRNIS